MRDIVLNKMMTIVNRGSYSKDDLEKIRYGLEAIYIFISKGIVVFTIAYFLGIIKYTLIFLAFYGLIRSFACGLHASKSWICLISSILIFIIIPYLAKTLTINFYIKLIFSLFSLIIIYAYAPADTKKRPIINFKKRIKLKFISVLISIIYVILALTLKNEMLSNSITFALILESLMISPIVYKIFKLPYDNYKSYK